MAATATKTKETQQQFINMETKGVANKSGNEILAIVRAFSKVFNNRALEFTSYLHHDVQLESLYKRRLLMYLKEAEDIFMKEYRNGR